MNLVCLEWDYAIKFFTYEKFMQNECWIHKKQSFLISFINLNNIVSNSLSFLTFFMMMKYIKKLWPKAPAKEDALDQISKNFLVYFIPIHFLRNQTKKLTIEPNDATIFVFRFVIVCLPKKMETEKWPKVADSLLYIILVSFPKPNYLNR